MDYAKPTLLVVSGPNGAGKSTHIQAMLPLGLEQTASFDRDKTRMSFEVELENKGVHSSEIFATATKMMENKLVQEMRQAISSNHHFVLETPLSHPDYWRYIDLFEKRNYQIQLNYLCLDKVSDCIARVGQRVLEGGHYVEPATIKGVYDQNLMFINEYWSIFKVVELYDGMKLPSLLVRIEDKKITYLAKNTALKKKWIKVGLSEIARIIIAY